jgi:Zn-dependent M28 family amino/carboxypeptidase
MMQGNGADRRPQSTLTSPAKDLHIAACPLSLSAASQQYFSLGTNQPPATSQQYFSLRTISTSHQPPAKRTDSLNNTIIQAAAFGTYCYLSLFSDLKSKT